MKIDCRVKSGGFLSVCAIAAFLGAPVAAHASAPTSVYVVPSRVDFTPNEAAATSVVIHGAFFLMDKNGMYGSPNCGYMYFTCAAGSEAMCRMQWSEIAMAIAQPVCEGFGAWNVVTKATLRKEGSALGSADTWDLGMGVSPGVFVSGACAPALALKCPLSPVDMSVSPAPDMTASPPPPDMSANPPSPDMSVKAPPADMAVDGSKVAAGCAVAHHATNAGVAVVLASVLLGLALRRRRGASRR